MTRSLVIGGVGVALLATALAWTLLVGDGEPPKPGPAARAPSVLQPPVPPPLADREPAASGPAPSQQAALPPAPAPQSTPQPTPARRPPSFDVVRIKPNGDAVLAGRAEPGATVTILDGGKPLGEVTTDTRGEWVYLPGQPLPAGARELGLSARNRDGTTGQSESVVVLYVPERDKEKTESVVATVAPAPPRPEPAPAAPSTAATPQAVSPQPVPAPAPTASMPAATAPVASAPAASAPAVPASEPKAAAPVIALATPRDGGASKVLQAPPPASAKASETTSIAVEVVDYDDGGELVLSGRATGGADVVLYLNNEPIGRTVAGKDGHWEMQPNRPVEPGQYQLRADELSKQGRVAARVELPFTRSKIEPSAGSNDTGRVVVQPGNSLWRIARFHYGVGTRYTVLYQANKEQIRDPNLIYPGQVFTLPSVN